MTTTATTAATTTAATKVTKPRKSKKRKLTVEERRALYATIPPGNKYVEAARKTQGLIKIYDPAFMI